MITDPPTVMKPLDKYKVIKSAMNDARNKQRDEQMRLMKEYDEKVYYPELRRLANLCGETGHEEGEYHNNGLGWTTFSCKWCGTMMRSIGPDGKETNEL
jgi:hypothetical protein